VIGSATFYVIKLQTTNSGTTYLFFLCNPLPNIAALL
jgi:hypothetical protein